MFLILIIFHPESICTNNDIIVEAELGQFSILKCNFDVERSAVFDRKSLKVNFPQHVNVLVIDISECDLDFSFIVHYVCMCVWLWELNDMVIYLYIFF